MIGIAFIGSTTIVEERHGPEAAANPYVKVMGFYNRTSEKAESFVKRYGGKVYLTLEEMLSDVSVDAVVISTVNSQHCQHTIRALEAGKHVLIEKPMALSEKEALEMINTAKKQGRVLMVGHNMRLEPTFMAAKAILNSGELGKVITFNAVVGSPGPDCERGLSADNLWFYDKLLAGMGVMGDLAIHSVDTLHDLLGENFYEISCFAGALNKKHSDGSLITVEDNALCILKTRSGVMGTLSASWSYFDGWNSATILFCEKGVLRIYCDPKNPLTITLPDGTYKNVDPGSLVKYGNDSGIMKMFIDSIMEGKQPLLDGNIGLSALKVCLAGIESSRLGQPVRF